MKQLYPIGTVVMLHGGEKALMVFGRKQMDPEENKVYDYIGVFFPEGYLTPEFSFLFQHEDIAEVLYPGFENEEEQNFRKALSEYADSYAAEEKE